MNMQFDSALDAQSVPSAEDYGRVGPSATTRHVALLLGARETLARLGSCAHALLTAMLLGLASTSFSAETRTFSTTRQVHPR